MRRIGRPRWLSLLGASPVAISLGLSLLFLSPSVSAQTAEELEKQYGREAMQKALETKHLTVKNEIFASLDWLPTFVNIAGGPKGDELKKQIEAGKYPGIVKTTLDGVDQRDYLEGKSEKSARDTFFYYSGAAPSAVRYKNWKIYFTMVSDSPAGFISGALPYHWAQVVNIKRDPFETSIGEQYKTLTGMGGALAGPVTAYVYDWNMLPIGQALWLKELETYIPFPPMQDPATYNLEQVIEQVKKAKTAGRSE
jgi:hypothetical protein